MNRKQTPELERPYKRDTDEECIVAYNRRKKNDRIQNIQKVIWLREKKKKGLHKLVDRIERVCAYARGSV